MTDYAQIITHTPEQEAEWRSIAASNPGRLARTIALQLGDSTREGDTQADIYPALKIVTEISRKGSLGVENPEWNRLVLAGIADALSKNVCEMVVQMHAPLGMPHALFEKVNNEMRSPFYAPLEILCNASVKFGYPPSKTDKMTIVAIRKRWKEMTERLWDEPSNTLRPEESHTLERVVFAQLVIRIMITEPASISLLYQPSDLTVQIIARHWKFSQGDADIGFTARTLVVLLEPDHPRQINYIRDNGLKSQSGKLVTKILAGVAATSQASKQHRAKTLIATFADHLLKLSGRDAADELALLMAILEVVQERKVEPEITLAFLKSTPLWNAAFRLLKRSAKPKHSDAHQPSSGQETETEMKQRLRVLGLIVGLCSNTLIDARFHNRTEMEAVVRIWTNEGIFGALEETIGVLLKVPTMTKTLTGLVTNIDETLSTGSESLLRLVQTQFPRWKMLGTLIRHDIDGQQTRGPPSPLPPPGVIPTEGSFWDHGVWQMFAGLQSRCVDKERCGKRGCDKAGTIECMCESVKYCSEACQKKDSKDHRVACGMLNLVDDIVGQQSQADQPKKTKKKKKSVQATTSQTMPGGLDAVQDLRDELD